MHIVYVTTRFVDGLGPTSGLPKYLLRVSLALIERGHKVTIVTCSNRSVEYEFFNINVRCIRIPKIIIHNNQEMDTLSECYVKGEYLNRIVHELYAEEKIDIIQYTSLCGVGRWHDLDIPSVIRLSSYAKLWPIKGREVSQNTYAKMEREAAQKCDAVFGPSQVVANIFQRDIERKVDVIETPFVMESSRENLDIYKNFFKGKKYILFYGTLIEYKGLDVIASIVYDLLKHHSDLYLAIIGDGDMQFVNRIIDESREMASKIIYHHAIGFEMLKPIIRNSRAVILPSIAENFSNACVESMALGQVVIGTDGRSFEQLIEDGHNGFLCQPGDGKSLLLAIERALTISDEEREQIAKKAIGRIDKLKPEYVVDELLAYYEKVIDDKCLRRQKL